MTCQLCGKNGHTTHRGYHQFDTSFSGLNNSSANSGQPSGLNNSSSPTNPSGIQAMMTTQSEFLEDTCWFPGSGATNHVTTDPNQLSIISGYSVFGKIHMGNVIGFQISHVGSNSFVTNSRVLHLKILLLVPSITKNLISVSQFCTDNNVFFEFNSTSCFVEDQITKKVLLSSNC